MERPDSTVNVDLSPQAKDDLDKIVGDFRMIQKYALGNILRWFVSQERETQAIVLGHINHEFAGDFIDFLFIRRHPEVQLPEEMAKEAKRLFAIAEDSAPPPARRPQRKRRSPRKTKA